jgi:hypothetical protein
VADRPEERGGGSCANEIALWLTLREKRSPNRYDLPVAVGNFLNNSQRNAMEAGIYPLRELPLRPYLLLWVFLGWEGKFPAHVQIPKDPEQAVYFSGIFGDISGPSRNFPTH